MTEVKVQTVEEIFSGIESQFLFIIFPEAEPLPVNQSRLQYSDAVTNPRRVKQTVSCYRIRQILAAV